MGHLFRHVFSAAALGVMLAACATAPEPSAHGGPSPFTVAGSGGPAVVLEAGAGGSRLTWSSIFLALATDTTVFADDRPGLHGGVRGDFADTPDTDGVRTFEEAVDHLRGLLAEAGVAPPYLLVGHSLGGGIVLTYATLHPEEVAGVVLVDGTLPGYTQTCEGCRAPEAMLRLMPPFLQAEVRGRYESELRMPAQPDLGALPVTVISATVPFPPELDPAPAILTALGQTLDEWRAAQPDMAEARAAMTAAHRVLADAHANGRHVEATDAGHFVHVDRPVLVSGEIRAMLDRLRVEAPPSPAR